MEQVTDNMPLDKMSPNKMPHEKLKLKHSYKKLTTV